MPTLVRKMHRPQRSQTYTEDSLNRDRHDRHRSPSEYDYNHDLDQDCNPLYDNHTCEGSCPPRGKSEGEQQNACFEDCTCKNSDTTFCNHHNHINKHVTNRDLLGCKVDQNFKDPESPYEDNSRTLTFQNGKQLRCDNSPIPISVGTFPCPGSIHYDQWVSSKTLSPGKQVQQPEHPYSEHEKNNFAIDSPTLPSTADSSHFQEQLQNSNDFLCKPSDDVMSNAVKETPQFSEGFQWSDVCFDPPTPQIEHCPFPGPGKITSFPNSEWNKQAQYNDHHANALFDTEMPLTLEINYDYESQLTNDSFDALSPQTPLEESLHFTTTGKVLVSPTSGEQHKLDQPWHDYGSNQDTTPQIPAEETPHVRNCHFGTSSFDSCTPDGECPYDESFETFSPQTPDENLQHSEHFYFSYQDNSASCDASTPTTPGEYPLREFQDLVLTRQQIREHNREVGWQQWVTLKGVVYHTTGFRDHFLRYNHKKAAEKKIKEQSEGFPCRDHSEAILVPNLNSPLSDDCSRVNYPNRFQTDSVQNTVILGADADALKHACDQLIRENAEEFDLKNISTDPDSGNCTKVDSDLSDEEDQSEDEDDFIWKYDVIGALRKSGLSMSEIEQEIAPFRFATLNTVPVPTWKYWESVRADVIAVHDDIVSRPRGDVSDYEREYLSLLQQWLRRYKYSDPEDRPRGEIDGNTRVFCLLRDPDSLRGWIRTLPPVDTDIPESGAWESHEDSLLSPLPDTHNVFAASLRSHHSDHKLLSHEISGDVAWKELPDDVIKNDVLTDEQKEIHEAREKLGDSFVDANRMRKKRQRLGTYFMKKYHFSLEKMEPFLQWGDIMNKNENDLKKLCPSDENL